MGSAPIHRLAHLAWALLALALAGASAALSPSAARCEPNQGVVVAQSWKRHTPWAHLERAARRLDAEGRKTARKVAPREERSAKKSRAEDDRRADRDEAAPAEGAREAGRESASPDRFALALAALAGMAVVAIADQFRRRRGAPPALPAATIAATVAAPVAAPAADLLAPTVRAPVAAPGGARARTPRSFDEGPRYEILERIGAGGMGVVYRARDRRLEREVALKRLSEQLVDHPKAVRYFLREARAVAGLTHPNIVTLYDVDEEDGVPFLTMELLDGRNLSQVVAAHGPLTSADTARVGAQAAVGLACAHGQGIVHRDVKSANLFLTRARVVKVMDFGLATMAEELRRAGTVLGTPQYMAPEQASGGAADHRVDLYALGVTLFHLATATWPFEDGDILHHHRHTPAPDPRTRRPDLSPPLAELILACMAKEPDKRPATAEAIAARLQAIATG